MFKKGDKYIHFTKYGGVNKGEVLDVVETNVINTVNKCMYKKLSIITTKRISLELDGSDGKVYKISGEMNEEGVKRIENALNKIRTKKIRGINNNSKIHGINED